MKAIKILIVDDEPIIRRGLQHTIPWEQCGAVVADTANDGKDAIRKLHQEGNIDIVITDVRMPRMDGLELAAYLHENFPHTRTIMVSGYDEFSYAQKAIKSGVKDYLLKPVDIDELVSKVKKIKEEIRQEQYVLNELQRTGLRNSILQQITNLYTKDTTELKAYQNVNVYTFISFIKDYIKVTKGMTDRELEESKETWKNYIGEILNEVGYECFSIFTEANTLLTCIIIDESNLSPKVFADNILSSLLDKSTIPLSFVWSEVVINVTQIKEKYHDLTSRRDFISPVEEGVSFFTNQKIIRENVDYPEELEKKVMDIIYHSESGADEVKEVIRELFTHFRTEKYLLEEVIHDCSKMVNKIIRLQDNLGVGKFSELELHYNQSINVNIYNTYHSLRELFEDDILTIVKKLGLKKLDKQDWLIKQAENYIREYYQLNIKVQEVADVINISSNYFSTLFKQKTGETFNEYVNRLRVNEAKRLLINTPFKISEISEQVGFHEYKYFVEVFKKFAGVTPTNYRKLLMESE